MRLLQLEELDTLVLELPPLIGRYERRDSAFTDLVLAWLSRAETALSSNRRPEAAEVATLRSQVVSTDRGQTQANLAVRGRPTRRKLREAAALATLDPARGALKRSTEDTRQRVIEAENVMRKIVAVADRKGFDLKLGDAGRWSRLIALFEALRADSDLAVAVTAAVGLVGRFDALILLDRGIESMAMPKSA